MCVVGACKEEVEDGFFDPGTTMGAVGRGGVFDLVEGLIKEDMTGLELSEQTGLVIVQLVNDVDVICRGE